MNQQGKVTLLLFCFSVCATAALVHYRTDLEPAPLRPVDLFDVVHQQLSACRANNYTSAYQQASATFQQRWSLDQFSSMIQNDYGRILKADRVAFGPWQQRGRHAIVEVFFINKDGSVSPCIYTLISEGENWKIDGTRWIKGWPTGQRLRGIRT